MKERYLLFTGQYYYPSGGFSDYMGSFKTINDARSNVTDLDDWYHIVDSESLEIIEDTRNGDKV